MSGRLACLGLPRSSTFDKHTLFLCCLRFGTRENTKVDRMKQLQSPPLTYCTHDRYAYLLTSQLECAAEIIYGSFPWK